MEPFSIRNKIKKEYSGFGEATKKLRSRILQLHGHPYSADERNFGINNTNWIHTKKFDKDLQMRFGNKLSIEDFRDETKTTYADVFDFIELYYNRALKDLDNKKRKLLHYDICSAFKNSGSVYKFSEDGKVILALEKDKEFVMPKSEYLYDLNETELQILHFIRTSPQRVSINKLSENLLFSKEEVISSIKKLIDKGLIKQDSRDKINWNHEQATYFTIPSIRKQIDKLLRTSDSKSPRALRAFLCHSSSDKSTVRSLYRRLITENVNPWFDERNLLPGQEWSSEIVKAVRESDVVIVCLSNRSINKAGYVQKEIKYALDAADEQPENVIFLIPLKIEECEVPERLRRWQWVNYFEENGYNKLIEALRIQAKKLGLSGPPEKL